MPLKNEKYFNITILIKGLIVVFTPILFHFDDINYLDLQKKVTSYISKT